MGLQVSDDSSLQTPAASWALKEIVQMLEHPKLWDCAPVVQAPLFHFHQYVYGGVPLPTSPVQLTRPPLEDV
ncbi:hypothetical protein JY651_18525 [Pyxidicoccus parkwayensis]|uniref:Uncharacterized protein n=1 Tax=Pyxidicoccus parkwayensis TaxID=2813578 RepID=A0ABX7P8M3_9BACT|nr:hypothetical protein [Pyxidicoccus parkwaysis]QSQ26789.1 hypothetical protein JY651_18525 [Pyxidicoccus parkwaysis]